MMSQGKLWMGKEREERCVSEETTSELRAEG